jgi:molybdate transport system regulatory protein
MDDRLEPRMRILLGSSIAIGPGKAALLELIGETGSIAAAGRRMGMSYRRAWVLTKTMNACFRAPLVEAAKGGAGGGGAWLTPMGREVLALYRGMEGHAAAAMDGYTLSDRGTWLNFKNRQNLTVLVEGDRRLFNQYGVMLVNPEKHPR